MSELGPTSGSENPFGSFFGDMMKMFMADGPLNWQLARQAAVVTSTGGEVEPNVDPLERVRLEELVRIADLHVSDATGLATSQTGRPIGIKTVTRAEWGYYTLDHYRPLFEALAIALTPAGPGSALGSLPPGAPGDPEAHPGADLPPGLAGLFGGADSGLLGNLPQVLGQVMMGAQVGSLVGQMARRALGQYDLPIPRPAGDELLIVPSTLTAFAHDWTLPEDDLRLWVCLSEVAHHAVLGRPHVRAQLDALLLEYVRSFRVDPDALANQLETLDFTDPAAIPTVLGDPEALLGVVQTPGQEEVRARLHALVAAIEGYVDHVVDTAGHRLIGPFGSMTEALRRRRVEDTEADRLCERLLGIERGRRTFDQGAAFVAGVVERGGEAALARLWASAKELPTPAEIDAPGLWLERIDLPD